VKESGYKRGKTMIEPFFHQTWKDKNSIPNRVAGFVDGVRNMARHLGFTWVLHDDNDVDALIAEKFPEYLETFRGARLIERLDMWRYCALFVYGGFYLDIDVEAGEKLKEIGRFRDKPVLQVEHDKIWAWTGAFWQLPSFCQFFMGFPAQDPLLKAVIVEGFRRLDERPKRKHGPFQEVLWTTGPALFTEVLWNSRSQCHIFPVDGLVRHHDTGSWRTPGDDIGPRRLVIRKRGISCVKM